VGICLPRVTRKYQVNILDTSSTIISKITYIYQVAIYIRLSIEDVRKKVSDSIGTQKSMLIKYLESQPDMQLYDIYEDVNYTGTNFNRPAFIRMIEDIQAGLVDCVLVRDLSRFGRSFEETGHYLERVFPFLQVRFISVYDNFDSLTATFDETFLMIPLKNLANEVHARDISKKVSSSFKLKRQRGEFCGSVAPYGYIKVGSILVIDEEAAPVVKQIYEWRLNGMGIVAIVQKLNNLNILPPSKHCFEKGITKAKKHEETLFWYTSAVKRILSNPVYTGTLVQGRYKSNVLKGRHMTQVEESEWVICKDTHPAIITEETFEAVHKIRESRKKEYMQDSINHIASCENIFKGLIVCGDCGKHMTRERKKDKFVFACYVYTSVNSQACTRKSTKEIDLFTSLYTYIKHEIDLTVDMSRIISDLTKRKTYKHQQDTITKQIDSLQRKLEQNRRFRGSLREDFKDGIVTEQDYIMMKADYEAEKDKIQYNLDELITIKAKQDEIVSSDNRWLAEFQRFESEQQLSSKIMVALVEKIKVYDGARIEVFLRYRDELKHLQGYIFGY